MGMSELSIAELQAESVELLPERETLSIIEIVNSGSATAVGAVGAATANNTSSVTVVGSANTALGSFNTNIASFNHLGLFI